MVAVARDMWPLVIVEKGRLVAVRNDDGAQWAGTLEELKAFSGVDLSGSPSLSYEKRSEEYGGPLHRDDALGITEYSGPVPLYESLIESLPAIIANAQDPFFGATLDGAKAIRVAQIKSEATVRLEAKWPDHKQRNVALGLYPDLKSQMTADIEAVIAAVDAAEALVASAQDVAAVKAVAPSWPEL